MDEDVDSETPFSWNQLRKLEDAISWRRDLENAPLANVWHLETVAGLAAALRAMIEQREVDERLLRLLWSQVPGDNRVDVQKTLETPGSPYPGGARRLAQIVNRS